MLGVLLLNQPVTGTTNHYAKLNFRLRSMLDDTFQEFGIAPHQPLHKSLSNIRHLAVLIQFEGSHQELSQSGVRVLAQVGDIFSAYASPVTIQNLIENPKVKFIQGEIYHKLLNNVSTQEIQATTARQQYGLSGRGVLLGIVDTGIDWRHEDFRHADGTTRIKFLLDLSLPGDLNGDQIPDGPDAYGGTLFTGAEINQALQGNGTLRSVDVVGHGSHVAGSAGGNGLGTGAGIPAGTYAGVAPEADLIIVKASLAEDIGYPVTNLVNSLAFIDSIAGVLGQPYVINFSLGGHEGAHDGTNLEELAIEHISGPGKPGKVVVVAAGNENSSEIHASGELSASQNSVPISVTVPAYTAQSGTQNDYALVDIWYDGTVTLSVSLKSPANKYYGPFSAGTRWGTTSDEGTIFISNAYPTASASNGDKEIVIHLFDNDKNKPPARGNWTITLLGNYGKFHLWLYGNTINAELTSLRVNSHLVSIPGTAESAITVGSYVTKNSWIDMTGSSWRYPWEIGAISTFSSPGPTRDGRLKPDLLAPGQEIVSTYSADAPPASENSIFTAPEGNPENVFILRDAKHALAHGTSMAAPHVAGVAALLLQANSQLDAAQMKQILISSARYDLATGAVPNYLAGYGKIDALAAVAQIEDALKFPAPYQLQASETPAGVQLVWQSPISGGRQATQSGAPGNWEATAAGFPIHYLSKLTGNSVTGAGPEIVAYQVFRSLNSLTDFVQLAGDIQTTTFLDAAVQIGQQYWYYVVARYNAPTGTSFPSNKAFVIWGSEQNIPLEIKSDTGTPTVYGSLPAGHILALRFDLNQDFAQYYLNAVRFFFLDYQKKSTTTKSSFRIHVYGATDLGKRSTEIATSPVYTRDKSAFYPNWTEIDLRTLNVVKSKGESLFLGIEYVSGDSATVLLDDSQNIPVNRAFYFANNRWEEHYDFWGNANQIGYPMIRALFTSRLATDSLPTDAAGTTVFRNYPNPFSGDTNFSFHIPEPATVSLKIYDILGRYIVTLINSRFDFAVRPMTVPWDGSDENGMRVPAGVYFAVLKIAGKTAVEKILLLR
jgi:subtilisin family serine protease